MPPVLFGKQPGSRGFTIIELVTVIVLLGILTAVAAPKFFSRDSFDDRFFFDDAKSALRYARQLAVSKGCYVQFTLNATRFILNYDSQCGSGAITLTGVVNRPGSNELYQNTDVPTSAGNAIIVFDPQGRAGEISGGNYTVFSTTQTINAGSSNLLVEGATGFVR